MQDNCQPKKISEMMKTCKLLCDDLVPIVQCGKNKVILIKDLINQIVSSIGDSPDALGIAMYAKNLAEQTSANSNQALKDLAKALAYATKAYKVACQFEDRVSGLEESYLFVQTLEDTLNNLSRQVNLNTLNIQKLLNSKVVTLDAVSGGDTTTYVFYQDNQKLGEITVRNPIEYIGSQYILVNQNHQILLRGLSDVAYTGNYYSLINYPTKLSQFINDVPYITQAEFNTFKNKMEKCCQEVKQQIQDIKAQIDGLDNIDIPSITRYNVILVLSEGVNAQYTNATTKVLAGNNYTNRFTAKSGYENLAVSCTSSDPFTFLNDGSFSVPVNADITISVTATKINDIGPSTVSKINTTYQRRFDILGHADDFNPSQDKVGGYLSQTYTIKNYAETLGDYADTTRDGGNVIYIPLTDLTAEEVSGLIVSYPENDWLTVEKTVIDGDNYLALRNGDEDGGHQYTRAINFWNDYFEDENYGYSTLRWEDINANRTALDVRSLNVTVHLQAADGSAANIDVYQDGIYGIKLQSGMVRSGVYTCSTTDPIRYFCDSLTWYYDSNEGTLTNRNLAGEVLTDIPSNHIYMLARYHNNLLPDVTYNYDSTLENSNTDYLIQQ